VNLTQVDESHTLVEPDGTEETVEKPERTLTRYEIEILLALTKLRKHVYPGTVTHKTKTERRARNKRARASRRANRGR
jgi:hypothetical protein